MSKFKVGDKVNAVPCESLGENYKDWQGVTVVRIDPNDFGWPITCKGAERYPEDEGAFAEHELELVAQLVTE